MDATKQINWGVSDSSDSDNPNVTEGANEDFASFSPSIPTLEENAPQIDTMTSATVGDIDRQKSTGIIADGTETGGETDIFSDEPETDAEKGPSAANVEDGFGVGTTDGNLWESKKNEKSKRKNSSSSSNSSWSSSDNEQTKQM